MGPGGRYAIQPVEDAVSTRKDFLAVTSVMVAAPALPPAERIEPAVSGVFEWNFNRERFQATIGSSAVHKQCFGATKLSNGDMLRSIESSRQAYASYYPAEVFHAVAVLYHGYSIVLAMNDTIWDRFIIPAAQKDPNISREIPEARPGKGNPYERSGSLREQVFKGTSFFVCHNAIVGLSESCARLLGESPIDIHAAIMKGIILGALVVPSGVMAINACQEAKFSYIQLSL